MVLFVSANKQFLPSVMIKLRLSVYYFWLQAQRLRLSSKATADKLMNTSDMHVANESDPDK